MERSEFDAEAGRLDLFLDFPRGARFACPEPGCPEQQCPVHDTENKTWRHLDFFQYQAHLHARVPRVRCPQNGVRQVAVSWARPGSGFTLLFEALLITFAEAMPVAKVAKFTGEEDTRPALLKRTRWLWLTNRQNLSTNDQRALVWLTRPSLALATARAHRWREDFQGRYDQPAEQAEAYLSRWCAGAMRAAC